MDSKLIEAAEIAAAEAALETGRTDWGGPVPIPNYTRIARAAILAFLDAAAGDEGVVEKVARALCALANPPESLIDPADHSEFVRTEAIGYRAEARAALSALKAEVKP